MVTLLDTPPPMFIVSVDNVDIGSGTRGSPARVQSCISVWCEAAAEAHWCVNITCEICSGPEATSATSPTTAAREQNPSGEISRSSNEN